MSEKVLAEGSLWKITGINLTDKEFARRTGAVKATNTSGDVWRLYFEPGTTPAVQTLIDVVGADVAITIVDPDHKALVTPTIVGR